MAKSGPETKLVKKMRDTAAAHYGKRLVTIKYHGDQYAKAGVSDVLCCLDGVFVAIEVKAPESYGGSVDRALEQGPTVLQRQFVGHVREAGGVAGFAATVEQFMSLLAQVENRMAPVCPTDCDKAACRSTREGDGHYIEGKWVSR